MGDPFSAVGSILGGVGSIAGGISGGSAQNRAADAAGDTAALQAAVANEQLDMQRQLQDLFIESYENPRGTQNARGDTWYFDPETNTYKIALSGTSQGLLDAENAELLQRLTRDAQLRRQGMEANATRRGREGQAADSYLARLEGGDPYTREGIEADLSNAALNQVDRAFRGVSDDASRMAMRTKTNAGPMLASLAERRGEANRAAELDAKARSYGLYENVMSANRGRNLDIYNALASRASNFQDVPFQSSPVSRDPVGAPETDPSRLASMSVGLGQLAGANISSSGRFGIAGADRTSALGPLAAGAGGILTDLQGLFSGTAASPTTSATDRRARGNTSSTPAANNPILDFM